MKGVIGVGNPIKGDDGIGVRLAENVESRELPDDLKVYELGVENFEILHVLKDLEKVILVDAVRFSGNPGDHRFFSPEEVESLKGSGGPHSVDILEILSLSDRLGERPDEVLIMGIEPKNTDFGDEFSSPVEKRVPELTDILYDRMKSFLDFQ